MKFGFDAIVISVQERESKGNMYYKVNLDQDGEIVTLDCTPEAAKQIGQNRYKLFHFSRSFFADSSYMLSFSVLCSCVCSRLISPSVSSWHKQDNTLMHQSPGHIQRRTPYNF